ncbi:MAG: hypothetical protein QG575_397 [Euryarchaeota archaeon]|nr:hypothetical protein [Euryarchaeota archaeon]
MQQVIPIMRKQGGRAIINISSGTALMYLPNMGAYSASKRALANISLTAREELKRDNIIVSVVYPYITLTDFENNTIREPGNDGIEESGDAHFPPDSAEFVAQKRIETVAPLNYPTENKEVPGITSRAGSAAKRFHS